MPAMDRVRLLLTEIAESRNIPYSEMSKAAGMNHAYIQQFLSRGVPVSLPERVRQRLSAFLNVAEDDLRLTNEEFRSALNEMPEAIKDNLRSRGKSYLARNPLTEEEVAALVASSAVKRRAVLHGSIPEFDLRAGASYGGGYAMPATVTDGDRTYNAEAVKAEWVIPAQYLQGELRLGLGTTDVIAVDGPSMVPDLQPGDRVLVDRSHRDPRQGGIFVVREGDGVIIKHVEVIRGTEPPRIICSSSNPHYRPFELVLDGESVEIIGRVAGRISRM